MKYSYVLDGIIKMSFLSVFSNFGFCSIKLTKTSFYKKGNNNNSTNNHKHISIFYISIWQILFLYLLFHHVRCIIFTQAKYIEWHSILIQIGQYSCKHFAEYSIATHKTCYENYFAFKLRIDILICSMVLYWLDVRFTFSN